MNFKRYNKSTYFSNFVQLCLFPLPEHSSSESLGLRLLQDSTQNDTTQQNMAGKQGESKSEWVTTMLNYSVKLNKLVIFRNLLVIMESS